MALMYQDSHWYIRGEIFNSNFKFEEFLGDCKKEFNKSKEVFVSHYKNSYHSPNFPPSWMMIELLPLGVWSLLYKNLANRKDKKQISDTFDLSPTELGSWLHSLTYIRNLCAHHARLWNRHFTISPVSKLKYTKYLTPNHTFSAQAAMIHLMLNVISPNSVWVNHLAELINKHPTIDPIRMGFKEDWNKDSFWNN